MRTPGHLQGRGPDAPKPPELSGYRAAVAELLDELAGHTGPDAIGRAEAILADRLGRPEFTGVFAATPGAAAQAHQGLLAELRNHIPNPRSALDLTGLVRIYLLYQIDIVWWAALAGYPTHADLLRDTDLVDLDALRRADRLRFRYRLQPRTLPSRVVRAAERRVWPARTPRTSGLRCARSRPEAVVLLNQLATAFADVAPAGTPPLWVTSLVRSVEHQHRLRSLGYPAMLPSAHCVGYAMDLEMAWFRRFNADQALAEVLLDRQRTGEINVIDEGQVWHVCISPVAVASLRRDFASEIGG
jgi:hypothetical protein